MSNLTMEERRARLVAMAEQHEQELEALLTVAQLKRLRQIHLQTHGLFAFKNQAIVKELALTAEQRSQIRDIERESFARRFEHGPGPRFGEIGPPNGPGERGRDGGGRDGGGRRPDFARGGPGGRGPQGLGQREENDKRRQEEEKERFAEEKQRRDEAMEKVLALFTDEQRSKWQELIGQPFDGPLAGPGFGPPRL
jgi:Spy/CpxP family protein refolding chaperone